MGQKIEREEKEEKKKERRKLMRRCSFFKKFNQALITVQLFALISFLNKEKKKSIQFLYNFRFDFSYKNSLLSSSLLLLLVVVFGCVVCSLPNRKKRRASFFFFVSSFGSGDRIQFNSIRSFFSFSLFSLSININLIITSRSFVVLVVIDVSFIY